MSRKTTVSIHRQSFLINGRPTYQGRSWRGMKIEGLLMNSRMVQGIFDDLNPETRSQWDYPDGPFDAERTVREFLAAMPERRMRKLGKDVIVHFHRTRNEESGRVFPIYHINSS